MSMFKRTGKSKREKKRKDTLKTAGSADEGPPNRTPPIPTEIKSTSNSSDYSESIATTQDEPGLIFTGEILNGRPVIKGGNIEKLVERLTYEKYNDTKYMKAFMLTFRSFTTPTELLQLLIDRFHIKPPTGADKAAFETGVQKVVRLRVFNVLKHWMNHAFYDFSNDKELLQTAQKFIQKDMKPTMENPANSLEAIIAKKLTHGEKEYEHIFTGDPPKPEIPNNITNTNKNNIMTYSAKELARQLTLIEYKLFAAIKPSECVSQHWMSKKKEELAPNILKMISRFNDVSNWVASEIVKCTDLSQRTSVLKMVIEIAEHCYELNNYNAVMEIISGLHSSSVFRLKQSWAGLPKKSVQAYEEMHATMSRDKSYKLFRAVLRTVNPPCIPYLGMYLTDLTFIEEGNPNNLSDGSINFTKRQRLSEVIAEIQTYQNTPYFLQELHPVAEYLLNAEALPEEQCYKLSLKREGRRGTQMADSDTPDLPFGDLEKKSSYLFDKPDDDSCIKFDKKENDGSVTPIIAGTLVKIVERLTYHEYQDMNFLLAFLMTFQTFTTSEELLDLLNNRFDMPKPANPSKQQMDKFISTRLIPIHLRICNLLKSWITGYPEDFVDTALQAKFYELISAWAASNPKIKSTTQGVKSTLEKKLQEPLPTPECRFLGFLCGSEETEELKAFYKGKGVLDFTEDLLAQQITLIEQNFFGSIRPRECLCEEWEPEIMETKAPNILAMKQNYEATRCWAITQVLEQSELQKQYSALTALVAVAEKLLGNKNFSSSMAITSGLQYLYDKYPEIWEWVPSVILEKYKELELLVKMPKRIKVLEKGDPSPCIPLIDIYINQLNGITNLMSDVTGNLINFERRRKQWDIYRIFEIYQSRPYTHEYDGVCGGYLYHCEIFSMDEIEAKVKDLKRPAPPDCRPELIDIQKNYEVNSLGDVDTDDHGDDMVEGEQAEERDEAALVQIKNYMLTLLNEDPDMLGDLLTEAKTSLASELMGELRTYTNCAKDELSVMHGELGICDNILEPATRILSRVFAGSTISDWQAEDEDGYVFGWRDEVGLSVVENEKGKWLAHVKSHLDKSYASIALRLFEFFSNSDEGPFKRVIVAATTTEDAKEIMAKENISVYNFVGTQLV